MRVHPVAVGAVLGTAVGGAIGAFAQTEFRVVDSPARATAIGAVFLAVLAVGFWRNRERWLRTYLAVTGVLVAGAVTAIWVW